MSTLSTVDQEINALYHALEVESLNAATLAQLTKRLRAVLRARRVVKEEKAIQQSAAAHSEKALLDRMCVVHSRKNKKQAENCQRTAVYLRSMQWV
jgi:hypothetical protein